MENKYGITDELFNQIKSDVEEELFSLLKRVRTPSEIKMFHIDFNDKLELMQEIDHKTPKPYYYMPVAPENNYRSSPKNEKGFINSLIKILFHVK